MASKIGTFFTLSNLLLFKDSLLSWIIQKGLLPKTVQHFKSIKIILYERLIPLHKISDFTIATISNLLVNFLLEIHYLKNRQKKNNILK